MQALVKYAAGAGKVGLRDIKEPVCKPNDIKVEVKACGICGTDIHIVHDLYGWDLFNPLGHEYSGVVVETGPAVKKFKIGDRITGAGSGGFAKYLTIGDDQFVFKLPDSITFEEGAFFEPLSCVTQAVVDYSRIRPMDVVLVTGPGSVGLCAMQVAGAAGATVIVAGAAADAHRLELAKTLGADFAATSEDGNLQKRVMELTDGRGVDSVLECSGAEAAINMALKQIKPQGTYVQIGLACKRISIDLDTIVYKQIVLRGNIGFVRGSWTRSIELVRTGKVNVAKLVSHTLLLSEWEQAFELCRNRKGCKILIIP
jgi:L-iditol 2-dehydrogenase